MLKIQELNIDDEKFRLREPRLSDYLRAKKAPADEFVFTMLAGMLLDDKDKEVGEAFVQNLPLRVFDVLSEAVTELSAPRKAATPLDPSSDGSTASPSPSVEQPSRS
jgi:hypothetical protein